MRQGALCGDYYSGRLKMLNHGFVSLLDPTVFDTYLTHMKECRLIVYYSLLFSCSDGRVVKVSASGTVDSCLILNRFKPVI